MVGGSGFLGREVARQAHRSVTTHFRPGGPGHRLDVRDRAAVRRLVEELRPDVIVNTAYVQADWVTTAEGAMHVAAAAAATGARLVHVSSDLVFSGRDVTYDETCVPDPVTPYGAAKAAAETAINGLLADAVVARTSLILGDGDSGHEKFVHALAGGTASGGLYTDTIRCPVHVTDLAAALLELAASTYVGIAHVAGADALSRHELGVLIARRDGLDEAALPAARQGSGPLDVRLDSTRTQARLRTRLRGAREFLAR
ncbi:sugar nucleotide-binding protein [Cryptosporangium japonicum]|uniref:Sugar nucleotide-binding protein n=1 Tax=Cryptosporangium japonicum TaxID=80872 RepID=A0ABN0V770_9ACTN